MPKPKLLQSMRANLRLRQFPPRTEEAYTACTRRFVRFHQLRHPAEMGEPEIKAFLVHLAQDRHLAPSTLAQALAALLFLYKEVLERPLAGLGSIPRARAPVRLSAVLTPDEVRRVLAQMHGITRLVAVLLYGSGMRLMECLTLRVKDLDLSRGELVIRRGKGAKDRVTVLPELLKGSLAAHLESVKGGRALPSMALGLSGDAALHQSRDGSSVPSPSPRVRRTACHDGGGASQRDFQTGHVPHVTTLARHALPGERRRYPDRAGTSGTPGCVHDDVVHARAQSRGAGRSQSSRSRRAGRLGGGVRGLGRRGVGCWGFAGPRDRVGASPILVRRTAKGS